MKKSVVLAAFGLSLAVLTGCGTPKAEDLIKGMQEYEMDSAAYSMYADVAVSVEGEDDDFDLEFSGDLTGEFSGILDDALLLHTEASYSYNVMGEKDKGSIEFFLQQNKKDFTVYVEDPDTEDWYSITLDEDTLDTLLSSEGVSMDDFEVDSKLANKLTDAAMDFMVDNATVEKKTEDVEGVTCYVVTIDATGADLKPIYDIMFDEYDEFEDLLDEADLDTDDFYAMLECVPFTITYYVAKDGGYMVACDVVFNDIDFEGMLDVMDSDFDDLGIESINIETLAFGITYTDVNNTEAELSKGAKNAEDYTDMIGLLLGSYDDYGWEDDDYAVEDDDYDWEDDDYDWDDDDYDWDDDYTSSWMFDAADYYGEYFYTVWAPGDYYYDPDSSYLSDVDGYNHYYTLTNGTDYIYVNTWAGEVEGPLDYWLKGDFVQGDWSDYQNYNCTMEPMSNTIAGYDAYFVTETYKNGGSNYTWYYVVAEYTDSYGADEYFTVEFTEALTIDEAEDYIWYMF